MAYPNEEQGKDVVEQAPADPWAAAFAALEQADQGAAETAAPAGGDGGGRDVPNPDDADGGAGAAEAEAVDSDGAEALPGGPGDNAGDAGDQDEEAGLADLDVTEDQIAEYRKSFEEDIRERTIRDVAAAYIKQGARNVDGKLGANISDPDICKRDRDGVPRFYNPETGREFTGDNPRRQAQEWVDDYNRELADAFNKTCAEYSKRLLDQEGGRLAVIEFAPKYKALDPVRKMMLDSILEDYEVTDENGDVVSYSIDLDKALAAVNRQVSVIQRQYGQSQQAKQPTQPSGPALDTPSVGNQSGEIGGKPQFKSVAEAMEWEQDRILEELRSGKKGRR